MTSYQLKEMWFRDVKVSIDGLPSILHVCKLTLMEDADDEIDTQFHDLMLHILDKKVIYTRHDFKRTLIVSNDEYKIMYKIIQ